MPTTTKSVTGVRYIWKGDRIVDILRLDRTYTRDNRGRFASGGGGGGSSGGGKKGGGKKGGGGGGGLTSMKASELQKIASDEGIDINTLSHKRRKSVLAAAIEAKRKGKDLREEGLLKAQKPQSSLAKKRSQSKGKGKKEESISDRVKQVKAANNKKPRKSATKKLDTPSNSYSDKLPASQRKNYHSVKDKAEFEGLVFNAINDSKKVTEDGGVHIYEVRRKLGESVPRDKFNQWTKQMQSEGKIQLGGGSELNASALNTQDVISTKLDGLRFRMAPTDPKALDSATKNPKIKKKYEEVTKDTPPLDPLGSARKYQSGKKITSQSDFDKEATAAFKSLNDEFQENGVVPIYKLREALGDRVTKKEFDDFIYDKFIPTAQSTNSVGSVPLTPQQKAAGINTSLSGLRTHVQLDEQ